MRSARKPARPARVAPAAPPQQTAPIAGSLGPSPSYQATQQTITRLPTPLRDTPQTVNVVTQRTIQERNITSMEDALRTVPGITFQAGEGGQQGDTPIIRGFQSRTDIFRDGIRDPGWYTRDLFSADRVEVYKGPSGFAFGRGSTGGAINTVTKLPTGANYVESSSTVTSSGGLRQELDASGKNGNVSGRIVGMYQDIETPDRDNVYTKRWGVAPSVQYTFTPNTKALVSYVYQGEESIPDYGFPYLPTPVINGRGQVTNVGYNGNRTAVRVVPIPRNNWFGVVAGPLADVVTTETHIVTAKVEHDLTKDIKVTNATRYLLNDRFARPTAPRSLGGSNNIPFGSTGAQNPIGFPVDQMTIGRQHCPLGTVRAGLQSGKRIDQGVRRRVVFLAHEQDAALLRSHERDRAEALLEPAIEANHEPLGGNGDGLLVLGARVDDDAVSLAVPGPREGGEEERGEDDEAGGADHERSLLISRRLTSSRRRWSGHG